MRLQLKALITLLILISVVTAHQTTPPQSARGTLAGRWRIKFRLSGDPEKNLIFEPKAKGSGSFLLLDTGPNNQAVPDPVPAAWSELTNNRVSFSGEVELPLGSCCREIGTLLFKGRFDSTNSISGKLIFVTSVEEEESPYKFHSAVGTFSATRMLN
jgi:hypothetical protein